MVVGRARCAAAVAGLLAASVLGGCATSSSGAGGSCAAPQVLVGEARSAGAGAHPAIALTAAPGQRLTVRGRYYVDGCNDGGHLGHPPPYDEVALVLRTADGATRDLGTARPVGGLGRFTVTVRVPGDAAPGRGALLTRLPDGGLDARLPVSIRR